MYSELINRNMGCIEILPYLMIRELYHRINRNMGCIEIDYAYDLLN